MVMCNRQEWLVDLVREPGKLLPLKPDTAPHQAPYLNRMSGHASGQSSNECCIPAWKSSLTLNFFLEFVGKPALCCNIWHCSVSITYLLHVSNKHDLSWPHLGLVCT